MMAKIKTKEELIEMSRDYFDSFKDVDTFYATPDGQFFTDQKKSDAISHARAIKSEWFEIERPLLPSSEGQDSEASKGVNGIELLSKVSGLSEEQVQEEWEKVKAAKASEAIEAKANGTVTTLTVDGKPDTKESEVQEVVNEELLPSPDGHSPQGETVSAPKDENTEVTEPEVQEVVNKELPPSTDGHSPQGETVNAPEGEVKKPEWKWTMEVMADWMNKHDIDFDLKDDKSALFAKAKAGFEKLTA
jgi:hypothetical protein